jgi:hypothetical protein
MLTQTQIKQLRTSYGAIKRVDPAGQAYKDMCAFLDRQDQRTLQQLAAANIPWVSSLALNRVKP